VGAVLRALPALIGLSPGAPPRHGLLIDRTALHCTHIAVSPLSLIIYQERG
jgi:hypothetical protein